MTIVSIAAPVVDQIGYFKAWGEWFSGEQPPSDAVMWFMSVRWWGRAGKIAAFLGGATVILDLIGPDRLKEWGRNKRQISKASSRMLRVLSGVFAAALGATTNLATSGSGQSIVTWIAVGVFMALLVTYDVFHPKIVSSAVNLADRILNNDRPAQAFRYVGVVLLSVGFHFDLLSS